MPAITKVEVQDYTDILVRIVIERGEDAPVAAVLSKADLPVPTVRDGKLTRSRGDMEAAIRAVAAETVREPIPDELGIEYAPSLRVEEAQQHSPPRR